MTGRVFLGVETGEGKMILAFGQNHFSLSRFDTIVRPITVILEGPFRFLSITLYLQIIIHEKY